MTDLIEPNDALTVDISAVEPETDGAFAQSAVTGLEGRFQDTRNRAEIGPNLYGPSNFENGIPIPGTNAAIKISGYVKADLIYDFNPIDSTDLFDTTTIPVDAPPRTNTRFHAHQSRLNFDVRWLTASKPARAFFEVDFFGANNTLRFRHAYGEMQNLIVGQTWTTFTDMASLPRTLDNEGAVSSISRRQAQVRWTRAVLTEDLTVSVSAEDPQVLLEQIGGEFGEARSPTPDFIGRVRLSPDWGQFQVAGLVRTLGFQRPDGPVLTENAWGFNFTGMIEASRCDKVYYQILFGDGIGSYKGLPDAAGTPGDSDVLGVFSWMIGCIHQWNDRWSSNFTYSENRIDNLPFQDADSLRGNTYLAANLIWSPATRVYCGVEYLFGTRENLDGSRGEANRLQVSFIFELP